MDARAHLDSYRESLKKDALDGCSEYSQHVKTANPAKFPTVFDYLKYSLDAARYHAEADDPTSYKLWLTKHQEAMILLFERMVSEVMFDAEVVTVDMVLALIDEFGWRWFKFSKHPITYKMHLDGWDYDLELKLIPRYNPQYSIPPGVAVMDADEISTLTAMKDQRLAREVASHKLKSQEVKFLGMHAIERSFTPMYRPIGKVNGDRVADWSLPLFGGTL